MSKYRKSLPQLADRIFLTDGGLETTLIFQDGLDLPYFASFPLIDTKEGRRQLESYYESYVDIALRARTGFMLDTATWRANPDWAAKLDYTGVRLDEVNRRSVEQLIQLRDRYETPETPMVVSGAIGPRGDGYVATAIMTADEARTYHLPQIKSFADAGADMATAFTLNYVGEAIGVALAAKSADLPVALSFTLETDGLLPDGTSLRDAILDADNATDAYPAYYMINCAHPTHFAHVLETDEPWVKRIRGIRGNASTRSHAELDSAPDLDSGDPVDFGRCYRGLRGRQEQLTILGGCCGTDCRHVEQISYSCLAA
jgi:homocysteine S-methyltransferase